MLGIVSEVLVMLVVSMMWCVFDVLNILFWLVVESCVNSGRILVCGGWCLCSVLVVLWILCLLGRNISMLLGFLWYSLLIVLMIVFIRLCLVLCVVFMWLWLFVFLVFFMVG